MVRRQALGWLGAAVCSVALVIAGGLMLSSVAVHRYLQASVSAQERGETPAAGATPAASELAAIDRTVSALTQLPGVATATTSSDDNVSVTMDPDATAAQCADVVFAMTQRLQSARVSLQLSLPARDGHAASVIDYRNVFDTPVPRSTVDSVSHAVDVAASVPGVTSVHVVVPYTWNLASGDLDVQMATDDAHHAAALKDALSGTVLADVGWANPTETPTAPITPEPPTRSLPPAAGPVPSPTHAAASHSPKASPAPSRTPSPTPTATPESH